MQIGLAAQMRQAQYERIKGDSGHMKMRTVIRCSCGQRILSKDVLQTGYFLKLFGPSFVYVKYRCPRCKKPGEQFVPQESWDERVLQQSLSELKRKERSRFKRLGPITVDEQVDFHKDLTGLEQLDVTELLKEETEPV
jgi:DNA-directed RNA polymerase subunit RPC12/RpoP